MMRQSPGKIDRRKTASGFTVIELLMVMVVGSILAASVVTVFIQQTRAMALQEDLVDLEQNLRVGMDILSREVRHAGLYTRFSAYPFSFGPISRDLTGDGTLDSSGDATGWNGSDTLLLSYATKEGVEIPHQSPGAGVNIYLCHDSGLDAQLNPPAPAPAPDVLPLALTRSSPPAGPEDFPFVHVEATKVSIDIGCPGAGLCPPANKCDNITFPVGQGVDNDGAPLSGDFSGGRLWTDLTATYFFVGDDYDCDGNVDGDPALMRVTDYDLDTCAVLAFGIKDLQASYVLADGSELDEPADPLQVRKLRITLIGETRNRHDFGGASGKRERRMTTEVMVRNLNF